MATKKPQPQYLVSPQPFDLSAADDVFARASLPGASQEPKKTGLLARMGDTGVSLVKGAVDFASIPIGLADLVTGGYAGKGAEALGFRAKDAQAILDEAYTPEQQAANAEVQQAQGFLPTVAASLANPSTIYHSVAQSAPSLLGGAAAGRAALRMLPGMSGAVAGGVGEGVVSAGQSAEQIRQKTDDGLLSARQAGLAAGSGALNALIGIGSGKLASRRGIGNADELGLGIAGATTDATQGAARAQGKSWLRRMGEGALTEGVLEEAPQSAQEQIAQNLALNKPWDDGVGNAAATGMLAGVAMGGAIGPFHGEGAAPAAATTPVKAPGDAIRAQMLPQAGPLSASVNAGLEQEAARLDAATPEWSTSPGAAPDRSINYSGGIDFQQEPIAPDLGFADGALPAKRRGAPSQELQDAVWAARGLALQPTQAEIEARTARVNGAESEVVTPAEMAFGQRAQDAQALPAPPGNYPQRLIGMSMGQTGRIVVTPDGLAVPETEISRINAAQRAGAAPARQDGMVEQAPQASPRQESSGARYLNPNTYAEQRAVDGQVVPAPAPTPAPPLARMGERRDTSPTEINIDPVAAYVREREAEGTPAGKAFAHEFRAGRITRAEVGELMRRKPPTPDEVLAQAAAQAPSKPDVVQSRLDTAARQGEQAAKAAQGQIIMADSGKPFASRTVAERRARLLGGGAQAVAVDGGGFSVVVPAEDVPVKTDVVLADQQGGAVRQAAIKAFKDAAGSKQKGVDHQRSAEMIADRMIPLVESKGGDGLIAMNLGSSDMNPGSRAMFEVLTGIKLPKQRGASERAIDAWAGVTEAQRAEKDAAKRAAIDAKSADLDMQAAKRAAANVQVKDGEQAISGDAWVDGLIEKGFTKIVRRGPKTFLSNEAGIGWPMMHKDMAGYARLRASMPPPTKSGQAQDADPPTSAPNKEIDEPVQESRPSMLERSEVANLASDYDLPFSMTSDARNAKTSAELDEVRRKIEEAIPKSARGVAKDRVKRGDNAVAAEVGLTPEHVSDFWHGTNKTGINPLLHGQDGLNFEIAKRRSAPSATPAPPAQAETAETPTAAANALAGDDASDARSAASQENDQRQDLDSRLNMVLKASSSSTAGVNGMSDEGTKSKLRAAMRAAMDEAVSQPLTPERVDFHLDSILKAKGSALRHYSLQKPKDDMRAALRMAVQGKNSTQDINAKNTEESDLNKRIDIVQKLISCLKS